MFQLERQPENHGDQQRREARLPHIARAPEHHVRRPRPRPGRADRDLFRKHSARDEIDRDAGQRGKCAVERGQDKGRGLGINSEEQEDTRREIWIERRLPCGGAGGGAEGAAEAVSRGEGGGDATHLEAESEIVVARLELISVADDDPAHAQQEGDGDDPGSWAGRHRCSGFHAWFYL